jgi:hypothetical protein
MRKDVRQDTGGRVAGSNAASPTRWLAATVLLAALLSAVSMAGSMLGVVSRGLGPGTWADPLALVSVAEWSLYVVVLFWVWRLARGGPGSAPLLSASLVGLLAPLLPLGVLAVLYAVYVGPSVQASLAARYLGPTLGVIVLLLFAIGLLRSRLAPRWVSWLGIAGAILLAVRVPVGRALSGPISTLTWTGDMLGVVFLVALGVSLWNR